VIDLNPAIVNGWLGDRQHPGRAITNQLGTTRSCLPARLRAG
jgi:hypothetical protein